MLKFRFKSRPSIRIDSLSSFLEAVKTFPILPFFPNNISGLSVEEMCMPGKLFGGNYDEGCWEWKGPVIRQGLSAYGKFFRRKAGFISKDLLPSFLNFRRNSYPVLSGTTEEMLLDIIRVNDSLTSTELKQLIFGKKRRERWDEIPDGEILIDTPRKSKSLESPLQKLQMGGWIIISDFEYKKTKTGDRYGWGVARYSTPETVFGEYSNFHDKNPQVSFDTIVKAAIKAWPGFSRSEWEKLLK